jgi:nucleoside-diphosphate-sugar epimerase
LVMSPQSVVLPDEALVQGDDPRQFIERISLATGDAMPGPILAEELLVKHYRDYHIVDTYARSLLSWLVKSTGDEERSKKILRRIRKVGQSAASVLARAVGKDPQVVSQALFGLKDRDCYFRFRRHPHTAEEITTRIADLKDQSKRQLQAAGKLRVLLTGGTGFVGKEIMAQAAEDEAIEEMVVLVRPKTVYHRITGELISSATVEERGADLLRELGLPPGKFRFIDGDIEKPQLGVAEAELDQLKQRLTHVIHCAASVAFDDPYPLSFSANVCGSRNALDFSLGLQSAPNSPFVAHIAVETSYIHGRQTRQLAREDEVVFPRNFYNNYYELTKAMASLETERFMLDFGLRLVQLCPAIVIGDSITGNNRGDQKVVNAPVNAFGRARKAIKESRGDWIQRSKAEILYRMARVFPGDPTAELNLIPVDWVARGIIAALKHDQATGERIHLATDNRITTVQIRDTLRQELRVDIKLAEPTAHRNLHLPIVTKFLNGLQQERVARALGKLGNIFGGYSEWGQPIHQVGNDVEILGLPEQRPDTVAAFRMLCRHNKFVQEFGQIKDPFELGRRERLWKAFILELAAETGMPVADMPAKAFFTRFAERFDRDTFQPKEGPFTS